MTAEPTGHRADPDRTGPVTQHSESLPGGLLREGSRVRVTYLGATPMPGGFTGEIVDRGATPSGYLALQLDDGTRVAIFTGPGVVVTTAPPQHPALG